ncbi:fungal-specific transcription factor domain-containing protein [Mortierella sp. GBAus27b]|nr:fungal-specific transcription factor domain-containing protein [Mortierella sp. GBAus27b]
MDLTPLARQKRLKAGTACTNCRKKKLRCTGTPNCARCVAHKLECIVDEALFLKTNSPKGHNTKAGGRPSSSSSSTSSQQPRRQFSARAATANSSHQSFNSQHAPYPSYHGRLDGSMSPASSSGDEMTGERRRCSIDIGGPADHHRRLSESSSTSFSSLSPAPSSPYSFSYHYNSSIGNPNDPTASFSNDLGQSVPLSHVDPKEFMASSQLGTGASLTKKRSSKDLDSTKPKQKRRNSKEDGNPSGQDSDLNSRSPPTPTSQTSSKSSPTSFKDGSFKSVVSTYCLDGHGQHFHGSSSGFYVCQLSSRFRHGLYPLPMAHLNDSDLWSHSLQMTSERELPSRDEMDYLLGLYFRYMYPFAPMFIRKTFMDNYRQNRPDLSQILILNAIFCNACWYSDDPVVKQDSTKYFNRAKIILDETYHVSRISTIQALLLMAHHQYATGNYSGGWLYTGMAQRIAFDIGLHRQDVQSDEPEQAEIRKRVWWALYMSDRLGSGILGRPMTIRDEGFHVAMPSEDWIPEVLGEDVIEYPNEPETVICCRLLWSVKLFIQMGKVLNIMHCIEAEVNGSYLADVSKTQLPQLHNNLTSWFLGLPNELMYTPYTMSPGTNHPPSPPTALMHMFYYTCLTMLHRPYLRPVNSTSIDANFLLSSRNICTAAATNVCHIADSLMLHGQLRDTCYFGMACLLAAGTVHVHNAITPTPSNRETTRAGLSKTVKAAHELVKTFPVAESLIAVALDVFASQTSSVPTEMAPSFIDISTFVAPFRDLTHLQHATIGNIYEAARLAKLAKDGPGPAPSIQLRHPYGNFSMPLPESTMDQTSHRLSSEWQTQIAAAVAMAAIAFGGIDPSQDQQGGQQQELFANPLDLPEGLRLAPIDMMLYSQVDALGGTPSTTTGTPVVGVMSTTGLDAFGENASSMGAASGVLQQGQNPFGFGNGAFAQVQSPIQELSKTLTSTLQMQPQPLIPTSTSIPLVSLLPPQPQPQATPQQIPRHHATMEDAAADPPSPLVVSSDDMDVEPSSLSDDAESSTSIAVVPTTAASAASASAPAPRLDAETQCDPTSDVESIDGGDEDPMEKFISALTKQGVHEDQVSEKHGPQQSGMKEVNFGFSVMVKK